MKIAIDVHVSHEMEYELLARGHAVIRAEAGELDEHFFQRVKDFEPDLYISQDWDWVHHAQRTGKKVLRLDDKWRKGSRFWRIMRAAGHEQTHILNG